MRGFLTQKGGSFSHLSPRTTVAIGNLEAKLVVRRDRMLQQKLEWQHSQWQAALWLAMRHTRQFWGKPVFFVGCLGGWRFFLCVSFLLHVWDLATLATSHRLAKIGTCDAGCQEAQRFSKNFQRAMQTTEKKPCTSVFCEAMSYTFGIWFDLIWLVDWLIDWLLGCFDWLDVCFALFFIFVVVLLWFRRMIWWCLIWCFGLQLSYPKTRVSERHCFEGVPVAPRQGKRCRRRTWRSPGCGNHRKSRWS